MCTFWVPRWMILGAVFLVGCGSRESVGFLGTLSGPGAELGLSGRDGALLWAEKASVDLKSCDDQGKKDRARQCLVWMKEQGIRISIGPMTSGVALELPALADSLDMVLVSPTVSTPQLAGRKDRFVTLMPIATTQSERLALHLLDSSELPLVVLHEISNGAYARGLADDLCQRARGAGRSIVLRDSFTSGPNLDFRGILDRIPDSSSVVVVGSGMDLAVFQHQRRVGKRAFKVHATQWAMGMDLLRVSGEVSEGMELVGMKEFRSSTPEYQAFREHFRDRFGKDPSFGAAFGWEAAQLATRLLGRRDLADALAEVAVDSTFKPLGWSLALDSNGDALRRPELFRIVNGEYVECP